MFDVSPIRVCTPLNQSAEYGNALALVGAHTGRLADGTLVLRRKFRGLPVAMLPRAKVHRETLKGLVRTADLHRQLLVITPDHPSPWLSELGAVPFMTPIYIAKLDLTGDLRATMHQKWRNRLVNAEQQNLRVTRQNLPEKPDQWLLEMDRKQQQTRGYAAWPEALTLAYAQANRGDAKLFTAFDGREPVAAMLILRHGESATYHISHTTEAGRAASAHNLLLWEAMQWLTTKGVSSLDLGHIDTDKAPGLARFKLGAGATLHPLGGTWLWWPPLGNALTPLKYFAPREMRVM
ncbi:acetyltransferase (GNAT) family protein [Shimia isoporae]|uniref:Acetyltransferase (GNAT) family protein n=1 Tax=Shimia isoporae TaxID=647720 RepID=A0A4R1NTG7_9RHOB|nr:GNAT family N-acetyltransferase [Shimia isoporae]TCL10113.1 acetyltransferase (GNAT) family protein [Shimia isoporae]